MTKTLSESDLKAFSGTEQWYRHGFVRKVLYTEGAKYVAEAGGAYWLLDEIAFAQHDKTIAAELFQVWKLAVKDSAAVLTCEDGNYNTVFSKNIEFTDFPLPEITLWFTDNVILLPSEY
jgi:hypothetical protein